MRLFYEKDISLNIAWAEEAPSDPLTLVPVLNPLVELRLYHWPLHTIKKGDRSLLRKKPGEFPLIIYRHPEKFDIRFMEGNRLFADLIDQVRQGRRSIRTILSALAKQYSIASVDRNSFMHEGVATIAHLRHKGIILGMKAAKRRQQ